MDAELNIDSDYSDSDEFKIGSDLFKKKWYYRPVQIVLILIIFMGYLLCLSMVMLPFYGWFSDQLKYTLTGFFTLTFSSYVFVNVRNLHRSMKHYF